MATFTRRLSYVFLCAVPFLILPLGGMRSLRVSGVYEPVGIVLFVAILAASWILGVHALRSSDGERATLAMSGAWLLMPFAAVALLWIGLATPWDATPPENQMRYAVLVFAAIAVTTGFVVLAAALTRAGEHLWSMPAFALNVLAGAAYVVWTSFQLGTWVLKAQGNAADASIRAMNNVFDALLFVACVTTYAAVALFAGAMGRVGWLGKWPARVYMLLNAAATVLIVLRGFSFPDPTHSSAPWYVRPAFIAGIPAIPWIMPFLLGVVLLRRAGTQPERA